MTTIEDIIFRLVSAAYRGTSLGHLLRFRFLGTNIVPNVWAIFHNEIVFENPSQFNPDRFLKNPNLPDPADAGFFGFGRRSENFLVLGQCG
jgi:hypothetical protein